MNFQWIEHTFPRYNHLFRLFLYWQGTHQSCHFFGRLPLGQLSESLLTCPYRRVDHLKEQLPRARVQNENGTIDWLCH